MSGRPLGMVFPNKRRDYIAGEDIDYLWAVEEVEEFDQLYKLGLSVTEIADHFERDPDDVVILILDRSRQGFIGSRDRRITKGQYLRFKQDGVPDKDIAKQFKMSNTVLTQLKRQWDIVMRKGTKM